MSKKRKKNRQTGELNPYRDSHDNMPGEHTIRRLFEITYICPLCQRVHETHQYITMPAEDLDEFHAAVNRRLREKEAALHIINRDSEIHHLDKGDFHSLAQAVAGKMVLSGILKIEMTPESDYTCDDCGRKFKTMAEHRTHMGVDAMTGKPTKKGRGIPACHTGQETR